MAAKNAPAKPRTKNKPLSRPIAGAIGNRLRGQIAVITGGSRGIGFAIARSLAGEGASVVITGRDPKTFARSARKLEGSFSRPSRSGRAGAPQVMAEVCEVRDPVSVTALFDKVRRRFGVIDILVNNAGVTQPVLPVEETSLQLWREVIDTNLTGVFLCTRAALPLLRSGGTVVNNISAAAKQTFPNFATYTAAKHGVLGFTLVLREELIPRSIRVVALMPGATDTDLWSKLQPDAPRDRMISPDSVAETVLYAALLSPRANVSEIVLTPTEGAL